MNKNYTGSKRRIAVCFLAVVLVLAIGAMVLCGCSDKPQGYRPESPSVTKTPPKDGSPEDYDALDNIAFVIGKLNSRKYYHSENRNTANATSLGIVNVKQTVVGSKDYKDGLLISSTISTSSSSLAPSKALQKFYGEKKVVVRTAASNKPADWNGLNTKWASGEPSEILDETQYEAKYGLWASEFSDYVINENTLLTKDAKPVKNGDKYELTVSLSVGANNADATYYYKKQMKTMGDLSEEPQFDDVSMTIVFGSDWTVSSVRTRENYTSKKMGITASCKGEAEITFSYDEKSADVSAYEDYFSKYASAPTKGDDGEKEMTAMDYIGEGLIPVLNGKSTLSVQLDVAGSLVEGFARLEMSEASLSRLLVKTPQTQFVYTDDVLYAMYDKAVAKLTVSELQGALPDFGTGSEEIVSAIENGVLEKEGNLVTVSCVLPLGTGDIPLVFGFSETDGKVEWKYINASLSVFDQEISATVEPSSEKVQFDPVIADDAVDMTLFAKDLADFSSLKALTGSADYATDAQDVHVDANIENAESGIVPVKADVAVSVQNYKTDDTGAAIRDENNARTPDGGHFVHAILADDVLYLSYSLVSLDAETALRVKISMFDLMMSGMELINILNDVFGFDLGGILSAATLTQESAPIVLQSMFTTGVGAAFTAETDAWGDHSVGLENASVNGGTLALTIGAVKNAAFETIAAPLGDYTDLAFLSRLLADFNATADNKATGIDLSGGFMLNILGENIIIDAEYNLQIGVDSNGAAFLRVGLDINNGKFIYGQGHSEIVVKNGLVVITKTQTTVYDNDKDEYIGLETPVVTAHAMTTSEFMNNFAEELLFAGNLNMESLQGIIDLVGSMAGNFGFKADIGEIISGTVDENGYGVNVDLGKLLGMEGGLSIQIVREKVAGSQTYVLKSVNIDLNLQMKFFGTNLVIASGNITMTNNNPGQAVDFSAFHAAVSDAAKTFGCTDFAALAQKVADNGGVLKTPEPAPEPEPAA